MNVEKHWFQDRLLQRFLRYVKSDAAPGRDVKPVLHRAYTGQVIHLCNGVVLDPKDFPHLSRYRGDTIITSDGATLLGADGARLSELGRESP